MNAPSIPEANAPYGILNCYKPVGMTSRDVVNRVLRLVRPAKVGHAGTLDPIACGVLLVPVGWPVRLVEYLQRQPKSYRGVFRLDCFSASLDTESEIHLLSQPARPSLDAIRDAAQRLVGTIFQQPPNYSAVKVGGKRAYERARKGEVFELQSRQVTIHSLNVVDYVYPYLTIDVVCGSGTYIRSLGDDLAKRVSSRAIMTELERTAIGHFYASQSLDVRNLTLDAICTSLHPAARAFADFPQIVVNAAQLVELEFGRFIEGRIDTPKVVAMDEAGNARGVLVTRGPHKLGPCRMFPQWLPFEAKTLNAMNL
jgi:tRNA pseudouridine55 synthase